MNHATVVEGAAARCVAATGRLEFHYRQAGSRVPNMPSELVRRWLPSCGYGLGITPARLPPISVLSGDA